MTYDKNRIIALNAQDKAVMHDPSRVDWLNPVALSVLKDAVAKHAKQVMLNGTSFDLTYNHRIRSITNNGSIECVKVKRTDGEFAPMGYVSMQRLKDFEFEGDET